ncbi:hypothetical protein C8R45DRAFT_1043731 [Mycena sanguinolenta]|nr:hypothetical protein C8R45DRAFT_1043731 [Mycena sanguinolenta]
MGRSNFNLSVLWLLSAAMHALSAGIQIGSLDGVAIHQCDNLTITWTGGECEILRFPKLKSWREIAPYNIRQAPYST